MKDINRKIEIMGIVNVTDDSFYAPSRTLDTDGNLDTEALIKKVTGMLREGADIIDIGACSTRPGAAPVDSQEEYRRLEPALKAIWSTIPEIRLSIDLYNDSIFTEIYSLYESMGRPGQLIINDVRTGSPGNPLMMMASQNNLVYIATHGGGLGGFPLIENGHRDIMTEMMIFFREFAYKAKMLGIRHWMLDPGFGFGKTLEENYTILDELERFEEIGVKILIGISRKSMIYRKFHISPEETLPQTQILHFAALERGADILRVHDVAEAVRTVEMYRRFSH